MLRKFSISSPRYEIPRSGGTLHNPQKNNAEEKKNKMNSVDLKKEATTYFKILSCSSI